MDLTSVIIIVVGALIIIGIFIWVSIYNYRWDKRRLAFFLKYPKKKEFMDNYENNRENYSILVDNFYETKTELNNKIKELELCPDEYKPFLNLKVVKLKHKYIKLKLAMDKYREDKELYLKFYNEMINFCKGK